FEHGDQGGTYNGNPLMTAVGVAIFDTLAAPGFLDEVNALGRHLSAGLMALSDKWGMKGERGQGLLRALVMDRDDGPALVQAARDRAPEGLLLNAPRGNLLRFMPALNVTADEIDTMLAWLDDLIATARA
ncbi:MAG: aminotransferase class III-fold pyridoxal phosphate-dependent enzyme, partial [Castellaniella sp.]